MVPDNYKLQESIAAIIGEGMESGTSNEKSIKSDILKLENLFWAVVTALVLGLVYIFRDTFGVAGIIIALLALSTIFIGYKFYKLKVENKEIGSEEVRYSEVRNIYLKQLLDSNTVCGYVLILEDGRENPMVFTSDFVKGDNMEITAFANTKFNFALLKTADFKKLNMGLLNADGMSLTHFLRSHFNVEPEVSYNHSPSLKTRYTVPEAGEYKIIFCRSKDSKKGKIEVNFLISTVPK